MTSRIRIGYGQVRKGDLIHVKGSSNTYKAMGEAGMFGIPIEPCGLKYVLTGSDVREICARTGLTLKGLELHAKSVVIDSTVFDYATRKQPHKPVPMPDHVGEWFLQARDGLWHRIVVTLIVDRETRNPLIQCVFPDNDRVSFTYKSLNVRFGPLLNCVDAETYYRHILPTLDGYDDED